VRQDHDLPEVLLVALTGWGQEEDRSRSLVAGFDHHPAKPAYAGALQALLASAEARRRPHLAPGRPA
jgi:hypothetical protein